jgi:DNA ligase (NAD+)
MGVHQVIGEIAAPKHIENARNYAAGALNLKDMGEFCTRAISFFAYGVYPTEAATFTEDMRLLSGYGFNTIYDNDIHNIYPCDGLVFRINSNSVFSELGYTAKHPRGAYAKKERAEAVETQILSVEWQVGKSGKVTPVAILQPVMIGDALVSRATLNNHGFIEMLNLQIGDTVGVIRAGEIIPCITYKVDA